MTNIDNIFKVLLEVRERAYAPYSHFKVGAVIECRDGSLIEGFNIENASYGLSMCAERVAIYNAYSRGYKKEDFISLSIIASSKEITTPCGACRQVLAELLGSEVPVYCFNMDKKYLVLTNESLLPHQFNKGNLEK